MSWLSDFLDRLKPSCREEHFWAKIAGEEELENDIIPSSREEGFAYKIAQRLSEMEAGGSGGGSSEPFVIPFTVEEYGDAWEFDSDSTLTPIQLFNGIKDAKDKGGVVARLTVKNSEEVIYYPAFNILVDGDVDPENDPCAFCEFLDVIEHFIVHDFQVNPYSPVPDYSINVDTSEYVYLPAPSGGNVGDVLVKTANGVKWETPSNV